MIDEILTKYRTVAVVGLSRDPTKYSYEVASYLKSHGFKIIPVNPFADEVLDEKCYKSLTEIPTDIQKTIEIIDIFRLSKDVPPIVDEAIDLRNKNGFPHAVWMQLGIVNEESAEKARKAGIIVVMDRCMLREHKRMMLERGPKT